jgi:hypothetical protein
MSRYPKCIACEDICYCGQVDALGRSIHLGCQTAALPPEQRHPKLAEHATCHGKRWEREEYLHRE